MRFSAYYLPITEWRALVDILLAVVDPRLAPLWLAALAGAWAIGGRSSTRAGSIDLGTRRPLAVLNIALYWICIPYRTQQRFMLQALGLAAVPLARLLDRGRGLRVARPPCSSSTCSRRRPGQSRSRRPRSPGTSARSSPTRSAPRYPSFTRRARHFVGPGSRGIAGIMLLLGMGCFAGLAVWAGSRATPAQSPRTEESCPACSRRSGTCRPGCSADGGAGTR